MVSLGVASTLVARRGGEHERLVHERATQAAQAQRTHGGSLLCLFSATVFRFLCLMTNTELICDFPVVK